MTGPLGEHRLSSERIFFSYQYLFFFCYSRYHSRLSFAFRRSSGHSSQALACGCALLGHTAGTRSWVSDSRLLFYFKSESIARSGLLSNVKKNIYIYEIYTHLCSVVNETHRVRRNVTVLLVIRALDTNRGVGLHSRLW